VGPAARRRGIKLLAIAIGVVIVVFGAVAWTNAVRWWYFPNNFAVVEPGRIYRSAQLSRFLIRRTLVNNHIGLVIDLSKDHTADTAAEQRITAELGIPRLNFVLRGNGTGRPESYTQALAAIITANAQGKAVLVHCQSGAQRTGGVIATYRMLVEGKSEADAFAEAEKYGHDPKRNPSLIPFVRSHLAEWKAELAAEHLLPGT
jgi:protein tyrosine/serine phosphatase